MTEWFYAHNGQQAGPVSEAALGDFARTGVITPDTLIWRAGMNDWQPYKTVMTAPPPFSGGEMRFCTSCGNQFPVSELAMFGESAVCATCKPGYVQRLRQGMTSTAPPLFQYAGFWIRFLAYLIDGIILAAVRYAITIPMGIETFTMMGRRPGFRTYFGIGPALGMAIGIAYYLYFWPRYGATPGKMVFGLKVVQPDGSPITVGQSVGRYFAYILDSVILFIGFMMIGWDSEKRALHDRLCDTRVIRTR